MKQRRATHEIDHEAAALAAAGHIAQLFYQQTLQNRQATLLWTNDGNRMIPVRRSDVAEWVSLYARGLSALNIARGARIALIGTPSDVRLKMILGHALAGMTTIALADDLPIEDRIRLLDQSHVSVLIAENAREALPYLQEGGSMPELQMLISLQGTLNLPHRHMNFYNLDEVISRGRSQPDRTSQWLQTLRKDDAALLIGARRMAEAGEDDHAMPVELTMKTHAELMQSCETIRTILSESGHALADDQNPIVVHGYFHHVADFIACQILPLTLTRSISYLSNKLGDMEHYHQLQPQLLISDSDYIVQLHQRLERLLTQESDGIDNFMARTLFRLGKKRYEKSGKMSGLEKLLFNITFQSVSNRVRRCIGSKLKVILSVDEQIPYPTQLFFETFGVRMVEIPAVFEKALEKIRL